GSHRAARWGVHRGPFDYHRSDGGRETEKGDADASHAAWWWHGLLFIVLWTRRLGPDIAPGLFAFVPLDNAAVSLVHQHRRLARLSFSVFWKHFPQEFITLNAELTKLKAQRTKRRRGDRYAQVSI